MKQKHPLLDTIYANEDDLLAQVQLLISGGADVNERTKYFETPLRVSSRNGRFEVVKYLFDAGADPDHLKWNPLFHAVAYGSISELDECLKNKAALHARDTWDRTPLLLSVLSGDIEKARRLIVAGANIADLGRGEKSALEYAIQMDDARMLSFLIERGCDFERYNDFGCTALIQAAETGAPECVRRLIEHGADIHKKDRTQYSQKTAIAHASTVEIVGVLVRAGGDLNQVEGKVRAELLGLNRPKKLPISKQDYLSQKHRVYGISNPQQCDISFWYHMVRNDCCAWRAREQFDDIDSCSDHPVWCYERYGKSITQIEDYEYIEIAGEHEDSYDPDFCIYNEVFHHKGGGEFTIYQYPKHVFPPTDFHTATKVDGYIYIIGNLGYSHERVYGETPVYRLDIIDFGIKELNTTGENPGWIYNHSAELMGQSVIRVQGGQVLVEIDGEEVGHYNETYFDLDLRNLKWEKLDYIPKESPPSFFPPKYKHFRESDKTLLAVQDGEKWRILKIIAVHRIDVAEGQLIRFENETMTAPSEDFLFVVAYSTSEQFESLEFVEKTFTSGSWRIDDLCKVCRTSEFPIGCSYLGSGELSEKETESFLTWKELFQQGRAKIH